MSRSHRGLKVDVMSWGIRNLSEQRLRFAIRAASGKEQMKALCEEFGISRPTGYLWLARYRENEHLLELREKSRRPRHSPQRTSGEMERKVIELRTRYPDWGARKLVELLKREQILVPRVTVHRILLRNGLIREQDRHRQAVGRFEREAPNQLWQMDFKGMPAGQKDLLPLVLVDDHSRYLVGLFATTGTQAEPVRDSLMRVFGENGLPEAMLMDHGTPWWNMQAVSGWTWLTVWLMKQGIRIYLSGYRHPQTQGKVERSNGSLERAFRRRRPQADGRGWQPWLDAYRQEYNHIRPHEALNMDVPAQHWKPSQRPFQSSPKTWEYADPAQVRRIGHNGGIWLGKRVFFVGRALIGENVQMETVDDRVLIWFCRTLVREFNLSSGASSVSDMGQFDRARTQGL